MSPPYLTEHSQINTMDSNGTDASLKSVKIAMQACTVLEDAGVHLVDSEWAVVVADSAVHEVVGMKEVDALPAAAVVEVVATGKLEVSTRTILVLMDDLLVVPTPDMEVVVVHTGGYL